MFGREQTGAPVGPKGQIGNGTLKLDYIRQRMRGATSKSGLVDMRQSGIDFVAARRQVEALSEVPATVSARAFSIYVGLFEFADDDGSVQALAADFMPRFEINRGSWSKYRRVLEAASLMSIERTDDDGRARPVKLLPPMS
jgi:hypothetical protein